MVNLIPGRRFIKAFDPKVRKTVTFVVRGNRARSTVSDTQFELTTKKQRQPKPTLISSKLFRGPASGREL